MGMKIAAQEHWVREPQMILTFEEYPMYVALLEELQLIRTLSDGIERMVTDAIATETIPSAQVTWEERALEIRAQLQLLSDEISQSINRST